MSVTVDFARRNQRPHFGTGKIWENGGSVDGSTGNWKDIAYGGGWFVAVSDAAPATTYLARTIDGMTWEIKSTSAANTWYAIDYGEGVFNCVARGGANPLFQRSTDFGASWVGVAHPAALSYQDIVYCGNSTWVACANNGVGNQFARSTDNGQSWVAIAEPVNLQWTGLGADPVSGVVIAVALNGVGNQIARSTDRGATWASIAESVNDTWNCVCWSPTLKTFVAGTKSANYHGMYSLDYGATWSTHIMPMRYIYKIGWGNNLFVGVAPSTNGVNNPYSNNGVYWTYINHVQNTTPGGYTRGYCICYGRDRWIALGDQGTYSTLIS